MKKNIYTNQQDWNLEYLTFEGLEKIAGLKHLFSTRKGGVSEGIFSSMNLSFSRGDEQEAVLTNYQRIAAALGTDIEHFVCSDQTHTTNVRVVTEADLGKGVTCEKDYTDVDGLITNIPGIVLATFYADCVPLYFVDPVKRVIGLSHSGWRGTVAQMGRVTVEKMEQEFGSKPQDIWAAIGPSICTKCYEVSRDVADRYLEGLRAFATKNGLSKEEIWNRFHSVFTQKDERQKQEEKYQMDLWKANELVMLDAGILPEHIEIGGICTACNHDWLFSHRASQGKRGNLGAFLMLTEQ